MLFLHLSGTFFQAENHTSYNSLEALKEKGEWLNQLNSLD